MGFSFKIRPTVVLPMWIPALASLSAIFTFAERRAEQLDLLDGVANEIRKSIDRRLGLDQRVIVGSP